MVDESIGTAIENLGSGEAVKTLVGVIILLLIAFAVMWRFLNSIIRDLKAELAAERADHKETKKAQLEDIRNMAHVAGSVDALRDAILRKA